MMATYSRTVVDARQPFAETPRHPRRLGVSRMISRSVMRYRAVPSSSQSSTETASTGEQSRTPRISISRSDVRTAAEEYGIEVAVQSEAYTTAECPGCGERHRAERNGDVFRCSCDYEGQADLGASRTFLQQQAGMNLEVGSMARPVRLTWDDHVWSELSRSPERASPNEERTDRSTREGKLASVGAA